MTWQSQVDEAVPAARRPTTASVRQNFATIKDELQNNRAAADATQNALEALAQQVAELPIQSQPDAQQTSIVQFMAATGTPIANTSTGQYATGIQFIAIGPVTLTGVRLFWPRAAGSLIRCRLVSATPDMGSPQNLSNFTLLRTIDIQADDPGEYTANFTSPIDAWSTRGLQYFLSMQPLEADYSALWGIYPDHLPTPLQHRGVIITNYRRWWQSNQVTRAPDGTSTAEAYPIEPITTIT